MFLLDTFVIVAELVDILLKIVKNCEEEDLSIKKLRWIILKQIVYLIH